MTINIASFGGRSHLLDTAKELARLGHTVRFYSYVPTKRAIEFGLPKECSYSLFFWALPFLLLFKLFGFKEWTQTLYWYVFDLFSAFYMKPCDVFIGQLPMHEYSMKRMKTKHRAKTIIESGISNIDNYISILKEIKAKDFPHINIQRYRDIYDIADYISVASFFSLNSFTERGYNEKKIFVNPYGVNLDSFHPTILDSEQYDCIVVGQWSKRKGSDMVSKICKERNLTLLHVGAIVDLEFPKANNFKHIDPVEEKELLSYYAKAKIFLFPSYEDGFGLVLCQAMMCGLPIVCSPNTGGPTLKKMANNTEYIIVMSKVDSKELSLCIDKAFVLANNQHGQRQYCDKDIVAQLSWTGYGKRYNDFLLRITK